MPVINNAIGALHKIKAKLYPNYLPTIKGAYTARTASEACLNIEQVCASLKDRGGSTGNYHDLVKHVREFLDEAAYQLCSGYAVDTGYFSIHLNINGSFNSVKEAYDPKKHPIVFHFKVRPALRRLAEHIVVEIEGLADTSGSIDKFTDTETDSVNETVTSGGLFSVSGHKMKIAGDDPSIGVYFVSSENLEIEVKAARLNQNIAGRLAGVVPQLANGLWRVVVKTQYNGTSNTFLKNPKIMTSLFELNAVQNQ